MRKVIAKRLTESKATVPHLYSAIEVELDSILKLRKVLKRDLDLAVSVNDLVIKASALALRDFPQVNSRWNKASGSVDSSTAAQVDISVAVATPNGLITPIVTGADRRGLLSINNTVKDLAGRAREGKLKPEEYQGGSFSISNLGKSVLACSGIMYTDPSSGCHPPPLPPLPPLPPPCCDFIWYGMIWYGVSVLQACLESACSPRSSTLPRHASWLWVRASRKWCCPAASPERPR